MRVEVNGVRLFFDVEGAALVPDGPRMREKPTLIALHGGPGADHSIFKPHFGAFADVAQVIYLDHRGNGRSDPGAPKDWTLAQWGDDVRGLCEALGIKKPIVYGASFGGFVAQAYATRHPDHVGKLILASTAARFDFDAMIAAFAERGGEVARAAAADYWLSPTVESRRRYGEICLPLYSSDLKGRPEWIERIILKDDVALWFNGPSNEMGRMDFREDLARLTCPALVMAGGLDPVTPLAFSDVIAESLTGAPTTLRRFPEAGHGIFGDDPEAATEAIRDFIAV